MKFNFNNYKHYLKTVIDLGNGLKKDVSDKNSVNYSLKYSDTVLTLVEKINEAEKETFEFDLKICNSENTKKYIANKLMFELFTELDFCYPNIDAIMVSPELYQFLTTNDYFKAFEKKDDYIAFTYAGKIKNINIINSYSILDENIILVITNNNIYRMEITNYSELIKEFLIYLYPKNK